MNLERATPQFRARITSLATTHGKTEEQVFAWWDEYCVTCANYDQSPVLSEFESWYQAKLVTKDRVPCEMCENGVWWTECCSGAGGCSCHGQPVEMGICNVCGGTGLRDKDVNLQANSDMIRQGGFCFVGSGPRSGYWSDKPAMGRG